jgi:hypothetical protein
LFGLIFASTPVAFLHQPVACFFLVMWSQRTNSNMVQQNNCKKNAKRTEKEKREKAIKKRE